MGPCGGDEVLELVSQGCCGYLLPGSAQGQAGWGFEQLNLVEGILWQGI